MAKKTGGLGRGLGALIPTEEINTALNDDNKNVIKEVNINLVKPNINQPRKSFDEEKINELSNSIKEHGVIQPLLVVREDNEYIIVAGERRYRASILAGLKKVPVIIQDYDEKEVKEIALIENLQREDLNEIEKAKAYQDLKDTFNMTQESIAKRLGTSRTNVANTLRLLALPDDIQNALKEGIISAGHARSILSVDKEYIKEFFIKVVDESLSVRECERLSKEFKGKDKKKELPIKKEEKKPNPYITDLEERIGATLGTKVKLKASGEKGSIIIDYYSNDDLTRLLSLLNIEE